MRLQQDAVIYSLSTIVGSIYAFMLPSGSPIWLMAVWIFLGFIWAPISIYLIKYRSEFYMKHRLRWTLVARFISSGAETVSFMYHPPPKMHIGSVVKSLLVFSPASNLFIVSITLRLPFLQHIAVQIVLFSMALFWLAPFCRSCIDHAAIFEKMGYGIDGLFSSLIFTEALDTSTYPCWMISLFVLFIHGFVIPNALAFVFEVTTRSFFPKSTLPLMFHSSLQKASKRACRFALVTCLAMIGMGWFLLCLARNP